MASKKQILAQLREQYPGLDVSNVTVGPSFAETMQGRCADEPTAVADEPRQVVVLVRPSIELHAGVLTIMVPVLTVNEVNDRKWKARNRRAGEAWKAVRKAVGSNLGMLDELCLQYNLGNALLVKFTRIGGRHLDVMANLGPAMKGVEDAVAFLLGADDGDPRWHPRAFQEKGEEVGVKIEVSVVK